MYLHLGQETIIRTETIVGIFDLENSTISRITRDYLTKAQKENRVVTVSQEMPKSFVVCSEKNGSATVYISQISSMTLLKRTGYISGISNV